ARHESFGAVSPEVGQLDEDLLAELLAADPDTTVTLLADLARATDRELRAAAQRLAARVFFRLGAAGRKPARGTRRLAAARAEGGLDLGATLDRRSLAPGSGRPGDPVLAGAPPRAVPAHRPQRLHVGPGGGHRGRGRGERGRCRQ